MRTIVALKDLFSAEGRRDPYPFYAELHRMGEACVLDPKVDRYSAVVHGYSAVTEVMHSPRFRVLDHAYLDQLDPGREPLWRRRLSLQTMQKTLFFLNPPEHPRVRRPFAQVFTARRIAALREAVVELINRRLDRLEQLGAGGRPVDFTTEFAYPLPIDVIGELVGVPEQDRGWFPARSEPFSMVLEPGPNNWRYLAAADTAVAELIAYFLDLIATRRAKPSDDLISALLAGQEGQPDPFSDDELAANLIGVYNAGFLTSVHAIGNGLMLLLNRPERARELREHPELAAVYAEEVLRFKTPLHFGVRWVPEEVEIAEVTVPAGGEVLVLIGAANRDPRRFPDPDVFDPHRPDNHTMSFSIGPHYCLGAPLSRMELELALPAVLRRFPKIAQAGPAQSLDLLTFHGYQHIPITVS